MSKRKLYIPIYHDVFSVLKLSGNEALVYALIESYCINKKEFNASVRYMAKFLNVSDSTIKLCLASLLKKGYITKKDVIIDKVKRCVYSVVKNTTCGVAKTDMGGVAILNEGCGENNQGGVAKISEGGVAKISHNNNNITINNTIKGDNMTPEEIFNEIFLKVYREKNGVEYIPNWGWHTSDVKDVTSALMKRLKEEKKSCGKKEKVGRTEWATYIEKFLTNGYEHGEKWVKDHFDMHTINQQINYLIKLNEDGKGNKENKPGHGASEFTESNDDSTI